MTSLTFRFRKSIWSRSREGIASNKVGRFRERGEILSKFNILRRHPERLIRDTIAFTGKRSSGKCVHSSRAGIVIISKNFVVVSERCSERIRGWTIRALTLTGGSSNSPLNSSALRCSTAGARRKTSTHSLALRLHRVVCVILFHPISIDVGEKLSSVKCLGKGLDFIMKF